LPFLMFHCLRAILPDRVPADGAGSLWNTTFRRGPMDGSPGFAVTLFSNGGTGARFGMDGLSATAYPSGVKGSPVEIIESIAPLLFHKKEFRVGSGGRGKWRGGHGLEIAVENRDRYPMELLFACDRIKFAPEGSHGGANGAKGSLRLDQRPELSGKGTTAFLPGEVVRILTPGGGGVGAPRERAKTAVDLDVLNELA
jgi:N-methylhydantoinase B